MRLHSPLCALPPSFTTTHDPHTLQFKATANPDRVSQLANQLLELRTACVAPATQAPYILNASGGQNNSPEGLAEGLTHAFVFIFASEVDRQYYVDEDPAHLKFKQDAGPDLERAVVVDYEPSAL